MATEKQMKIPKEWDYYQSEEYLFHLKAMAAFDRLTQEEKFQTVVRAGIYNKKGELTELYGGEGKADPEEREAPRTKETDASE